MIKLQQLSMISISQRVWQTSSLKSHIKEIFSIEDETGSETARYLDWINTARDVYNELKQSFLPLRLTHELLYVVKQMGDQIYDWYHYVERTNRFLRRKCGQTLPYPDDIYWTTSGLIDVEKIIVMNWIKNNATLQNASCAVYFVSILHGLQKRQTDELWNLMHGKSKIICRQMLSYKESYASAFLYSCVGDPQESLEIARKLGYSTIEQKQRFLLFVGKGYIELMKSLWYQLDDTMRNNVVDKGFRLAIRRSSSCCNRRFKKKRFDEIAFFLYCQMNEQQRYNILRDLSSNHYMTKLLYIIASKPYSNLFVTVLDDVLKYITEDVDYVYSDLIVALIYDMLEDFDCNYVPRGNLVKIWKRLPDRIKKDIQFNEVFEGLIDEWDLNSLRTLLNIPEFENEKEQIIKCLAQCYLKSKLNGRFHKVNELAEYVFIDDSDEVSFKNRIRISSFTTDSLMEID